jgi:hypothetical protein
MVQCLTLCSRLFLSVDRDERKLFKDRVRQLATGERKSIISAVFVLAMVFRAIS